MERCRYRDLWPVPWLDTPAMMAMFLLVLPRGDASINRDGVGRLQFVNVSQSIIRFPNPLVSTLEQHANQILSLQLWIAAIWQHHEMDS